MCAEWKVVRTLGSGGFGSVELWKHSSTGRKLAIKKCKRERAQLTEIQRNRWTHEVFIMGRLNHRNIVKTEAIPAELPHEENALPILCMEYCSKGDLRKLLNEVDNSCGVSEKEARNIMNDVLSAVEYLHSHGITHRDLKPENIVMQETGDTLSYKLIDLGYAKELGEASTSASIVGTLNYIAPELLWRQKYSCSVDYWSLGILFYEVVTGMRPFLPKMHCTMTWMNYIKHKAYTEICAYESNGQVVFDETITRPTDLSRPTKEKLVEWFRVVLQWDPKERGKARDADGVSQLVVFKLMKSILTQKIIQIFCISLYRIDVYELNDYDYDDDDDETDIDDLQRAIANSTGIPVNEQTLTDYSGTVVLDRKTLLSLPKLQDPVFIFGRGCILPRDTPQANIPTAVQKMIEQSTNLIDFDTAKDFFRETLFFMKQERRLFQLYIFALSIKIDLVNSRMLTFGKRLEEVFLNVERLSTDLDDSHLLRAWNAITTEDETKETRDDGVRKKVHKLRNAGAQIRGKFKSLADDYDELKDTVRQKDYTIELSECYDEARGILESLVRNDRRRTVTPRDMIKALFHFLKVREALLRSKDIAEIARRITSLEDELLKLESSLNSVVALTTLYRNEYGGGGELIERKGRSQERPMPDRDVQKLSNRSYCWRTDDTTIYDSLIICHALKNLLSEMQKKSLELPDFDVQ